MSAHSSDSEGWTVVNKQDVENDAESSSSSSIEFVQLERGEVVSFHLKDKTKSSPPQPEESDDDVALPLPDSSDEQEAEPEADPYLPPRENLSPSDLFYAGDNSDSDDCLSFEHSITFGDQVVRYRYVPRTLRPWENGWYWDDHDTCISDDDSSCCDTTSTRSPAEGAEAGSGEQSVEVLTTSEEEDCKRPETAGTELVKHHSEEHDGAMMAKPHSDSDSDSDFVRLDASMADEESPLLAVGGIEDVEAPSGGALMEASGSSMASSISSHFRFVHLPRRPIDEGERTYRHSPNTTLNSILSTLAIIAFAVVMGIAVGHYMGHSKNGLHKLQMARMRALQDEYLLCLRQTEALNNEIGQHQTIDCRLLLLRNEKLALEASASDLENTAKMVAFLEAEKMMLEQRVSELEAIAKETSATKQTANELQERISLLEQSRAMDEGKVTLLQQEKVDLEQQIADLRAAQSTTGQKLQETLALETELQWRVDNLSTQLQTETKSQEETSVRLASLKSELNAVELENLDLRSEVARLRYTQHPGNAEINPELTTQQLKNKVNQLANENQDLISEVGRMRYSKVPPTFDHTAQEAAQDAIVMAKGTDGQPQGSVQGLGDINPPPLTTEGTVKEESAPSGHPHIASTNEEAQGQPVGAGIGSEKISPPKPSQQEQTSDKKSGPTFLEYVDKTQETVHMLSNTLKDTWQKVSSLSTDFLNRQKDMMRNMKDKVRDKVNVIGQKLQSKLDKVQHKIAKVSNKFAKSVEKQDAKWRQEYYDTEHEINNNDMHPNREEFVANQQNEYENIDSGFHFKHVPTKKGVFDEKPLHRQKQSMNENDQYREFWHHAGFDPAELLEGFFEGNNREWRKHEKRVRKLHGRLNKLNDDIFLAMDDDDIEDIYEDFEDFEDDVEDVASLPQRMKTWLTCQVRWWKSRFQRKHRDEDLMKNCGNQLMRWQLRALCKPHHCQKKKCKVEVSQKLAGSPLCHIILTEAPGQGCDSSGCHTIPNMGFHLPKDHPSSNDHHLHGQQAHHFAKKKNLEW